MFVKCFFHPITTTLSLLLLLYSFSLYLQFICSCCSCAFFSKCDIGNTILECAPVLRHKLNSKMKIFGWKENNLLYEILKNVLKLPWFSSAGRERERKTCSKLIGLMCGVELRVWNLHLSHSCQIRHLLSLLISTWGKWWHLRGGKTKQQQWILHRVSFCSLKLLTCTRSHTIQHTHTHTPCLP